MNIKNSIKQVHEGQYLDAFNTEALFDSIFEGSVSDVTLAAILVAMKIRKEQPEEIIGAVRSMRKYAVNPGLDDHTVFDTCGTGGDNSFSFNISTSVAIILNAMGYSIAKHGNRSVSSKSGSADFLEALNIPINLSGDKSKKYFDKNRFLFMFAPEYHPAMKNAVPVRKELGVRTIFNFLGPLTNPSSPARQMTGVFHPDILPLYARAAAELSFEKIVLYSSSNGMDEVSPLYPTHVYEVHGTSISTFSIDPSGYINQQEANSIPVNCSAMENAELFMETISSPGHTPLGKVLALNTALALYTLGLNDSIKSNFNDALDAIHGGTVNSRLEMLRQEI
ncbi:MAG: anthranilate phosphoribosyltransferase [Spirochaetota bacterium]